MIKALLCFTKWKISFDNLNRGATVKAFIYTSTSDISTARKQHLRRLDNLRHRLCLHLFHSSRRPNEVFQLMLILMSFTRSTLGRKKWWFAIFSFTIGNQAHDDVNTYINQLYHQLFLCSFFSHRFRLKLLSTRSLSLQLLTEVN